MKKKKALRTPKYTPVYLSYGIQGLYLEKYIYYLVWVFKQKRLPKDIIKVIFSKLQNRGWAWRYERVFSHKDKWGYPGPERYITDKDPVYY